MLIEVILAVTLLGIAAIPLLNLQANLINYVWREHDFLDRIWMLQNLFAKPEIKKITFSGYAQKRFFEDKNAANFNEMKYECKPVDTRSELAEYFADLYVERSSGSWQGLGGQYTDSMTSFVYIAPVKEKTNTQNLKEQAA